MKAHFASLLALLFISFLPASYSYGELYRPGYHFTPPINWMNDPNGLVFNGGLHHLYYQYNPYGTSWGNMSWGHAVSSDLVHWMNLPIAIPMYNDIMIFSGSVIVDANNTSGFCESKKAGCMVAFYTQQSPSGGEAQGIAYSNDGGFTYTEYAKNPVIDINQTNFRDPWVFWYEPKEKWVMVVSLSTLYKIRIYSSKDLVEWTFESDFGPDGSSTDGVWEDPDLFLMTVEGETTQKWVLTHSIGSWETIYHIGDFDGTTFTDTDTVNQTNLISIGLDFSEAVTYNNEPTGRRLMMGWMDNRIYGDWAPTTIWRGQQSMIRELKLRRYSDGLKIAQTPIEELTMLRYQAEHHDNIQLNKLAHTYTLQNNGTQVELNATFTWPTQAKLAPTEFGFKVFVGEDQETIIGYDVQNETLYINRTYSGVTNFSSLFTNITSFPLSPDNSGTVQIQVFLDQSSIEVFGNNGSVAITNLVFPDPTKDQVQVYVVGGSVTVTSLDCWLLHTIWPNTTDIIAGHKVRERDFLPDWSIIE